MATRRRRTSRGFVAKKRRRKTSRGAPAPRKRRVRGIPVMDDPNRRLVRQEVVLTYDDGHVETVSVLDDTTPGMRRRLEGVEIRSPSVAAISGRTSMTVSGIGGGRAPGPKEHADPDLDDVEEP